MNTNSQLQTKNTGLESTLPSQLPNLIICRKLGESFTVDETITVTVLTMIGRGVSVVIQSEKPITITQKNTQSTVTREQISIRAGDDVCINRICFIRFLSSKASSALFSIKAPRCIPIYRNELLNYVSLKGFSR